MKNIISRHNRGISLAIAILSCAFLLGGITNSQANNWHHHNKHGYYDHNGNFHHYGYHNHHRGYWNQTNGTRVWINL
ncbi:MAG: hypothetical protein ABI254_01485 [Chthoniobacterales bacterium]